MAAILGRAAVCQLTNSVLSEILFPISPHLPSFQNDCDFEAYAIQILIFKVNPHYKEKAVEFPQGIQMTGLGWGAGIRDGGAWSGNISEWEAACLEPGMGDICTFTSGQKEVVSLSFSARRE